MLVQVHGTDCLCDSIVEKSLRADVYPEDFLEIPRNAKVLKA